MGKGLTYLKSQEEEREWEKATSEEKMSDVFQNS